MNRRQVLAGGGIALTTAVAGCTGDGETIDDPSGNGDDENTSPSDNESEPTPDVDEEDVPQDTDSPTEETPDDGSGEPDSEPDETWHGYDVEQVKEEATQPEIDDFIRNMEDYSGESLYFEYAYVNQKIEGDGFFQFHLQLSDTGQEVNGDAFGWWVGDRFLEGDNVEVWAVGEDPYTYETIEGDQRTVPALSIVDMKIYD